jgi:hypothetical protein
MSLRSPPEPGSARREAKSEPKETAKKKGAYGGNMVSPIRASSRRTRGERGGEGGIRTLEAGMYPT